MPIAIAAEEPRGWGGVVALLAAITAITAYHYGREWWLTHKIEIYSPPPEEDVEGHGVNELVTQGSDPDDPTPRIVDYGTHSIQYDDSTKFTAVQVRHRKADAADLDDWLAQRDEHMGTMEMIREAQQEWRVSESTVKRALRRVRQHAAGGAE